MICSALARPGRRFVPAGTAVLGLLLACGTAWGQGKAKLEIPPKEHLTLTTKDGVQIACDFYPGGFQRVGDMIKQVEGTTVAPIILVHGKEGRGSDFDGFAVGLQSWGFAVAVPDLRGHGRSTTAQTPAGVITVDAERMRPADFAAMVADIEAVKKMLLERNNAGELNIELLGVVGADLGALIAMYWAVHDWSWPQLPAYKQGRDVKALVLLSPPASFRGLSSRVPLKHPIVRAQLPTMIAFGARDSTQKKDAERLYTFYERSHAMPAETLKLLPVDVSLEGTQLLQGRGLNVAYEAGVFLQKHLVNRAADLPWTKRENPLSQ